MIPKSGAKIYLINRTFLRRMILVVDQLVRFAVVA
jgi:hypothetical protein